MQRTKLNIPDAINVSQQREFTQIPNNILRNPEISLKAKGLLSLLLSNKEGWKSYIITIKQMTKDNEEAIRTGVIELEKNGYLKRITYRDAQTKIRRGSFWAYTDTANQFDMEESLLLLTKNNLEITTNTRKPNEGKANEGKANEGKANEGKANEGKSRTKKTNIKKTNKKEKYIKDFLDFFPEEWKSNNSFKKKIEEFILHRKELGKPMTEVAYKRAAEKLLQHDVKVATAALKKSIEECWIGVFPESISIKGTKPFKSKITTGFMSDEEPDYPC